MKKAGIHARYRDGERQRRNTVPNVEFILNVARHRCRNAGATLYGDVVAMDDLIVQPLSGLGCYAE